LRLGRQLGLCLSHDLDLGLCGRRNWRCWLEGHLVGNGCLNSLCNRCFCLCWWSRLLWNRLWRWLRLYHHLGYGCRFCHCFN
jgi:hypothetical protein